jgi:hypothetical protein
MTALAARPAPEDADAQARPGAYTPTRGAHAATGEGYTLWRCSSLRPITIRWISEVPSPISSSGASR